jgi:hypothetical protein
MTATPMPHALPVVELPLKICNGRQLALAFLDPELNVSEFIDLLDEDAYGLNVEEVDLGYPIVRDDMAPVPDAHGEWDNTAFFASRVVSITGVLAPSHLGSRQRAFDYLSRYLLPDRRPVLIFMLDADVAPRYLQLRSSAWSGPVRSPDWVQFQGQWRCGDPVAYSVEAREVAIIPSGLEYGRKYVTPQEDEPTDTSGWTPDRYYPDMRGATQVDANNAGSMPSWPVIRVFGGCTNPQVINDVVGARIALGTEDQPFVLRPGEVLTIGTRNRRIYLGADPSNSRYNYVDFTRSSWWPLMPGANDLRFVADPADDDATARIYWNDAYL